MLSGEEWGEMAGCKNVAREIFYPEDGDYGQASEVCEVCPVRVQCLGYALRNNIKWGMWGNTSPETRRKIRKRRRIREY